MPPSSSDEREEERRLNTRTLTIASVASAAAAAVTSQLWIAGTWIAAAVTPLIVAVVSELLGVDVADFDYELPAAAIAAPRGLRWTWQLDADGATHFVVERVGEG